MLRRLAFSLLILTLSAPACVWPRADIVQSVRMMTWTEASSNGVCTAWAYQGFWITAGHCVSDDHKSLAEATYAVDGHPLSIISFSPYYDLAALIADDGYTAPSLPLSHRIPSLLDAVYVCGYPHEILFCTRGVVSSANVSVDGKEHAFMLYSLVTGGGASGSPIFDNHGEVIGVVQAGIGEGDPHSVSAGVSLAALRLFLLVQ